MSNFVNYSLFPQIEAYGDGIVEFYKKKFPYSLVPPIPITHLVEECYGFSIEYEKLNDESEKVSGILEINKMKIIVNEKDHVHRQRFTIAHEFFHWFIDKEIMEIEKERDEKDRYFLFVEDSERNINLLAAALLVPRKILRTEISKTSKDISFSEIQLLANSFKVSKEVMINRLSYLAECDETIRSKIDHEALIGAWKKEKEISELFNISTDNKNSEEQKTIKKSARREFNRENLEKEKYDTPLIASIMQIMSRKGIPVPDHEFRSTRSKSYQLGFANFVLSPREALNRPLVLEFSGMPNSGKDTQIALTSEFFSEVFGYKVRVFNEGYRRNKRRNFKDVKSLFFYSLMETCKNVLEANRINTNDDVHIHNRGVVDSLAFGMYHERLGNLDENDFQLVLSLALSESISSAIDAVFQLIVSPAKSLLREENENRKIIKGITMAQYPNLELKKQNVINLDSLELLQKCYELTKQRYRHYFNSILEIKTDDKEIRKVTSEITDALVKFIG